MKFGIIGYGHFGKLWEKCLKPYGSTFVYDSNLRKINSNLHFKRALDVDILFLLVPISKLAECCNEIKPYLKPKTMVVDACSVKVYPVHILKKHLPKTQFILPTHPLFGPETVKKVGLKNQKIVLCPIGRTKNNPIQKSFERILKKMKLQVIYASPTEHDKKMAFSQALVHFLARALLPLKLEDLQISTMNYQLLWELTRIVHKDTDQLFFDMQHLNPFALGLRNKFFSSISQLEANIQQTQDFSLSELRQQINDIDHEILQKIAQRFTVVKKVGALKKGLNKEVFDSERETKLATLHQKISKNMNIDPKLADAVFTLIIEESRKMQK